MIESLQPLPLIDAELWFAPAFLPPDDAADAFAVVRAGLPWESHRLRLFGRWLDAPRLSAWIGDPDAHYRYSGQEFAPHPWTPPLRALCDRVAAATGGRYNSVLANLYRDGRDSMGWHSDDEPELGDAPVIASLSLGATRRFLLRHRREPAQRLELALGAGSLLVMAGATQQHWRHAVPRTARPVGERINLTFRWVETQRRREPLRRR